jgi:hypothetical protein
VVLIIIIIFLLSFFIRFAIAQVSPVEFDTYEHLYFSREVKKQKSGPYGFIITRIVDSRTFYHPFLWHYFIGMFNTEFMIKISKVINPIIDSIFCCFIYLVVLYFYKEREVALRASLIYMFTPMWFTNFSCGPRTENLTPRIISETLLNILLVISVMPFPVGIFIRLLLGSICSFIIISSSKFGFQALLFITPLVSLISLNGIPIACFLLGFLGVILFSGGKFLIAIKEQIHHLVTYFKRNMEGKMEISSRNSIHKLFFWDKNLKFLSNLVKFFQRVLILNSYTGLILKCPIVLISLLNILFNKSSIDNYLIAPVISSFIIFIIVNTSVMLFLGEAERYINHVSVFIVIIVSLYAEGIFKYIIIYGFLFWVINLLTSYFLFKRKINIRVDGGVVEWLKNQQNNLTILNYPYYAVGVFRIMLETNHSVIYPLLSNNSFQERFLKRYEEAFPFVKLDLIEEMSLEFNVNCLIINKNALLLKSHVGWIPRGEWNYVSVGNPVYDIYVKNNN